MVEIARHMIGRQWGFLAALIVTLLAFGANAGTSHWQTIRDTGFGFTFSYPPALFDRLPDDEKPSFYYFAAPDGEAKFLAGAWHEPTVGTPQKFKQWLLDNAQGYDEVTYRPRGRTWFVLSGYRGEQIYYEKVMFSCGNQVVNVFAMVYPVAERKRFDPIVERMEDQFHPARRCP